MDTNDGGSGGGLEPRIDTNGHEWTRIKVEGAAWDRFGEKAAFLGDYSAGSYRNPGFGLGVKKTVHPGFLWVQSQSDGQLRPGTRGIATPGSTSRFDDLDQVHLFKMSGFLPSSEPAIGRSQELATVGWCRRTAELPLLVELERAACPQKSRKNPFCARGISRRNSSRHHTQL